MNLKANYIFSVQSPFVSSHEEQRLCCTVSAGGIVQEAEQAQAVEGETDKIIVLPQSRFKLFNAAVRFWQLVWFDYRCLAS